MQYELKIVPDSKLPRDVESVLVERRGMAPLLIVTERAAGAWRLVAGWESLVNPAASPDIERVAQPRAV